MSYKKTIAVLDVSSLSYGDRVCAAAVQGLLNRAEAKVFLDYGYHDDPLPHKHR